MSTEDQSTTPQGGDVNTEVQKAVAEQLTAINQKIQAATGHGSLDALLAAYHENATQLDARTQEVAGYQKQIGQNDIKSAVLSAAIAGQAINPEMVYTLIGGKAVATEGGAIVIDGQPVQEAVQAYLNANLFLVKPSGNQGGGTPINIPPFVTKNPWAKGQINLTEQSNITRSNPAEAERLKKLAGVNT